MPLKAECTTDSGSSRLLEKEKAAICGEEEVFLF